MRLVHSALAPLLLGPLAAACNTVDPGECWPNTSGGFGGGGTIPIGAGVGATSSGDFISPPPYDPLGDGDGANPCIEPQGPCEQKCLTDYENQAAGCGTIGDAAERRACQDGAYASYKSCRGTCSHQSDEKCRQACDNTYNKCMDKCKDGACRDACFKNYTACLKKCER